MLHVSVKVHLEKPAIETVQDKMGCIEGREGLELTGERAAFAAVRTNDFIAYGCQPAGAIGRNGKGMTSTCLQNPCIGDNHLGLPRKRNQDVAGMR